MLNKKTFLLAALAMAVVSTSVQAEDMKTLTELQVSALKKSLFDNGQLNLKIKSILELSGVVFPELDVDGVFTTDYFSTLSRSHLSTKLGTKITYNKAYFCSLTPFTSYFIDPTNGTPAYQLIFPFIKSVQQRAEFKALMQELGFDVSMLAD